MKTKHFFKALTLNKHTVADLNEAAMKQALGGADTQAECVTKVGVTCITRCGTNCICPTGETRCSPC